jgi:tetratricopeptide (TPR) repeat protein
MQITCQHCDQTFDHEPPTFGGEEETTICPSCGRDTAVSDSWAGGGDLFGGGGDLFGGGGGGGADARVYCFNCGKAMTPREGELIPVCDDCRQDASQPPGPPAAVDGGASPADTLPPGMTDEPVADWMIRKANGNVYGPFPAETIVEWIKARKINPDEEVAHIGGAWRLFGQHEEFGRNFESGGSEVATGTQATSEIDFRRRSPVRDAARSFGRVGVAILAVVAIGGGVWWAISNDVLVLSEDTVEGLAGRISETGRSDEPQVSLSEGAERMLRELRERHPDILAPDADAGTSTEYYLRGRTLMLRDSVADLLAARIELERAVVLDPANALALAGLAEAYNVLAIRNLGSLDLQRETIYLIELAEQQDSFPAEVLRAKATWLIYLGDWGDGVGAAREALQKNPADPSLHFLLGVAAAGQAKAVTDEARAHFDKALELDPGFHQVWYELGRGEEDAGNLRLAIEHYEKKIGLDGRSAGAHTRLGLIYERIGDHAKATTHYDRAIALNPRDKDAVIRRGILAYQTDGAPATAAEMLAGLLGEATAQLTIRERKEVGVHISAARRLAGDLDGALEAVDVVLKEDPNYSPGLFHKGLALVAAGKPNDAIPLYTRADSPELTSRERAVLQFWAGRAAFVGDQRQDALEAYTRAIEFDPEFLPAYLWRSEINLILGDPASGSVGLLEHISRDPLDYARVRRPGLFYEPLPSLASLAEQFKKAARETSFAPVLNAAAGIVLFHQGQSREAADFLGRAISQDGRSEAAFFYMGLAKYRDRQYAAAGAHFTAALAVEHSRGIYHVYMGEAYMEQGRIDEAVGSYEKGLSYGAKSSWSHTRFAAALASQGDDARARTQLDEALALDAEAVAPRRQEFLLEL